MSTTDCLFILEELSSIAAAGGRLLSSPVWFCNWTATIAGSGLLTLRAGVLPRLAINPVCMYLLEGRVLLMYKKSVRMRKNQNANFYLWRLLLFSRISVVFLQIGKKPIEAAWLVLQSTFQLCITYLCGWEWHWHWHVPHKLKVCLAPRHGWMLTCSNF